MQRYQHGGVNITGFQLVNYSSSFVQKFMKLWRTLDTNIWPGASNDSIPVMNSDINSENLREIIAYQRFCRRNVVPKHFVDSKQKEIKA